MCCIHAFFTRKVERTGIIIADFTYDSLSANTLVFTDGSLEIDLSHRIERGIELLWMIHRKSQNDLIGQIIWFRNCQCHKGIKREFHISWIAFLIGSFSIKSTHSKIPLARRPKGNLCQKIHLTDIAATSPIRIQTALNQDIRTTYIKGGGTRAR